MKKTKKKPQPKPQRATAAELHELARVLRRSGDAAAAAEIVELARAAERGEEVGP